VDGANLSGWLNLGATFTDVPGGTAHWTFAGGKNHHNAEGDVPIVIQGISTVTVTCPTSTPYTGSPIEACTRR